MKKIFLSSIISISILLTPSVSVFATPLENNTTVDATNTIITNIENSINTLEKEIESNNSDITNLNSEISKLYKEETLLKDTLDKQQEKLDICLRQVYKNNNVNPYLTAIFTSKSFSNMLSQVYTTSQLVSYQNGIIDDVKETLTEIDKNKEELNLKKEKITNLKKSNDEKLIKLKAQTNSISELLPKSSNYSNELTTTINNAPSQVQNIIEYAYKFIGTPYVWGATGPSSFDCSGFVQYVYKKFGINLPRTTYEQINIGTPISRSDLQPGDLVFEFGTSSSPEHVGIYVGNGEIINAVKPGVGVAVSKIYNFVGARRIN